MKERAKVGDKSTAIQVIFREKENLSSIADIIEVPVDKGTKVMSALTRASKAVDRLIGGWRKEFVFQTDVVEFEWIEEPGIVVAFPILRQREVNRITIERG